MSQVQPDVDLAALARPETSLQPPKRSPLRIVVPLALLLGFAAVLASTLTDLFRPVHEVTVVRPVRPSAEQSTSLESGAVAVQASGWIEPDPFPLHVTALAGGIVEELFVEESDRVSAGQVVARLVDDDARIARDAAVAELAIRESERDQAVAGRDIARERLDEALAVTEARDAARAVHGGAEAAAAQRAAAVLEAESRVRLAEDELEVQRELERTGANGIRQVELAEGALDESRARLAGLRAEAAVADARVQETRARLSRAERDFELRLDDRLELAVAEAKVDHAEAELSKARATLEDAELRLSRMEVRSPADGVVLERLTLPGMILSLGVAGHEVCSLYDPEQLRVRVDVPQPEVGRIFVGQRAEIECEARRRQPYEGEVIRVVQKANLSKVTLEVHVRILDPDELARPEMLAQVRFFGSAGSTAGASAAVESDMTSVMIPASLVDEGAVWVVGPAARAERRSVELGVTHGALVEVLDGLNLTDKLVDSGRGELSDGDRLRVRGGAR